MTTTPDARHLGDPADDVVHLHGDWHVGRSFLGLFPYIENACPCPKARCGLAIPVLDIYCPQHYGEQTIREAHTEDQCDAHVRRHQKARRS